MPTFTEKAEPRDGAWDSPSWAVPGVACLRAPFAGARSARAERGFTLVELMVVIAIMALAATAVVMTLPGEERSVRSEADRLAARLAAARDVAVIEGRSVSVDFAPSGYDFERRIDGAWQPLPGRAFERRNWPDGVGFAAGDGQTAARLTFDRVGTSPNPQTIVLSGGGARAMVRISATGEVSRDE